MPFRNSTRLTAPQLATLREYASAGSATFYVSSTRPTERALWGKGLLTIVAQDDEKPRLRYEISDEGRRVVGNYALVPWLSTPLSPAILGGVLQ